MESNLTEIENQLLLITRQFLLEQETERAIRAVSLQASLEKQLGIDSLGKVELFQRFEKSFGIEFNNHVMAESDTLSEIALAVQSASPAKTFFTGQIIQPALENTQVDVSKVTTLTDVLIEHAIHEPDRPHIYFQEEDGQERIITYGELLAKASNVANRLIELGIQPDDTVSIMLPTSDEFFATFFGILLAGAIPVPIYPPFRPDRIEEYALREIRILNNAEVRALITFDKAEILSKLLQTEIPSLKWVMNAKKLLSGKGSLPRISRSSDHAALIQYSSGSTGDPKGVLLLHKNVLANIRSIQKAVDLQPTDSVVSWLPLYHDMGLMSWINSMYFGVPITIMSPLTFLNRPERWLWAMHYHRGTISAGPNFAYELCVKKIDDEKIQGLDLSAWRYAFNGAEAVNPQTMKRFYEKFKRYGFNYNAFYPVYGLAENTVALSFPATGKGPVIDRIARESYEKDRQAIPAEKNTIEFVCEGKAIPDHELRIVDDNNQPLPERHVGSIQFRGPSAMQGYYRNMKASEAAYTEGWWDTGDLGYLVKDELYVTGRKKDLIIKAGRNINPESIEEVVGNIPRIRKGCVIAFGMADQATGTEKIIVVAETALTEKQEKNQLAEKVVENLASEIGVPPDHVLLVSPGKIPKTSSGKLQRQACKNAYSRGELIKQSHSFSSQMVKLFFRSGLKKLSTSISLLFRTLFTVYAWTLAFVTALLIWPFVMLLPQKAGSTLLHYWTKSLFILGGMPLAIQNKKRLAKNSGVIYVANHSSYVDAFVLLATLPPGTIFIGKKELLNLPIIASVMKKLNFITVDRLDFSQNIEDVKIIKKNLQQGNAILIFPEGSFSYASGVRPFKSGAFQLAVDTQTPLCPIALRNTRQFWRSGTYLFQPTRIEIIVHQEILPTGDDWQEVSRLRIESRKWISEQSGEPFMDAFLDLHA